MGNIKSNNSVVSGVIAIFIYIILNWFNGSHTIYFKYSKKWLIGISCVMCA